ncbi:GNAT family N-acetyltransferase [Lactovum odontotermitis]
MKFKIDTAKTSDLAGILNVERSSFPASEAMSEQTFRDKIRLIPDTFLVAHTENGAVAGICLGPTIKTRYIDDRLFIETQANSRQDTVQTVLSLAVLPKYRSRQLASDLLQNFIERAQAKENLKIISLTCIDSLIPFYEAKGFVNEGLSASQLGGETWYNMVLNLAKI